MRLSGKSLSEVVPVGVVVPMAAVGFLFVGRTETTSKPMLMPEPATPGAKSVSKPAPAPAPVHH